MRPIPHETFVYFAKGVKSSHIKIGYSKDPDKRCADFDGYNNQGERAKVIFAIPGGLTEEREYHTRFREQRLRGEWFVCKGDLAIFIKKGRVTYKKWRNAARPQIPIKSSQPAIQAPDFSKVPPVPYIFGYARVSTVEQSLDMQVTALNDAGCTRIFTDKLSGKTAQRLQFKLMMKHLQPGDTIVVYSLSRLFRNTKHLLELFDQFKKDKITLRSITEKSLDITTSHGRMIATVLAAVDENEVGRVRDRTIDGMAERARQGVKFGAPPKVTPADAAKMKHMRFKTGIPVPAIAAKFHVSAAAVYQHTKS